jgi:hypothetical protein
MTIEPAEKIAWNGHLGQRSILMQNTAKYITPQFLLL